MLRFSIVFFAFPAVLFAGLVFAASGNKLQWVVYDGFDGPGNGKHIVLVSGDDEYRSEETLPQLGKILAKHHGFKCTVLFAIDPKTGEIKPDYQRNIPGLKVLKEADLMVLFLRFRDLPDDQMKQIVEFTEAGKPIVALRTSTHAFHFRKHKTYARYTFNSREKGWKGGFGGQVLGDTWLNHHGGHGRQSTRGIIAKGAEKHPILMGIKNGDIWGPTDVYGVRLPLPKDCTPVVMGQVLTGMKFEDPPLKGKKNDPMMPVAWTKAYKTPSGQTSRVFTTTMGASQDITAEGSRRMLVNACYWAMGMEGKIDAKSKVDIVGKFQPTRFKFGGYRRGVKPSDLVLK